MELSGISYLSSRFLLRSPSSFESLSLSERERRGSAERERERFSQWHSLAISEPGKKGHTTTTKQKCIAK